jgi:hypothetical protein
LPVGRRRVVISEVETNMDQRRQTRPLKLVGAISLTIWVLANSVMWYHYAGTRPVEPNLETGNVYALNTHGSVVYLTIADCIVLYGTLAAGCIATGFVVLVSLRRDGWSFTSGRTD